MHCICKDLFLFITTLELKILIVPNPIGFVIRIYPRNQKRCRNYDLFETKKATLKESLMVLLKSQTKRSGDLKLNKYFNIFAGRLILGAGYSSNNKQFQSYPYIRKNKKGGYS